MSATAWITAAAVSAAAHFGMVVMVDEAEPRKKPLPPIEMQLAKAPPKVKKEPPPPPPPPPPRKPELVKKVTKVIVTAPPPPEEKKIGVNEETSATNSDFTEQAGVSKEGVMGNGSSMDKTAPPPPDVPAPPPPPPPQKARVFPSFEVTQLPRPKHAVQPEVPDAFRQAQREALVVIEVVIDMRGKVVDARVLKHAEYGLDGAALAAAKATVFEPALIGTQPVSVRYQIPYRFKVRG